MVTVQGERNENTHTPCVLVLIDYLKGFRMALRRSNASTVYHRFEETRANSLNVPRMAQPITWPSVRDSGRLKMKERMCPIAIRQSTAVL